MADTAHGDRGMAAPPPDHRPSPPSRAGSGRSSAPRGRVDVPPLRGRRPARRSSRRWPSSASTLASDAASPGQQCDAASTDEPASRRPDVEDPMRCAGVSIRRGRRRRAHPVRGVPTAGARSRCRSTRADDAGASRCSTTGLPMPHPLGLVGINRSARPGDGSEFAHASGRSRSATGCVGSIGGRRCGPAGCTSHRRGPTTTARCCSSSTPPTTSAAAEAWTDRPAASTSPSVRRQRSPSTSSGATNEWACGSTEPRTRCAHRCHGQPAPASDVGGAGSHPRRRHVR